MEKIIKEIEAEIAKLRIDIDNKYADYWILIGKKDAYEHCLSLLKNENTKNQ